MKIITTVGTSLIENAKLGDDFKELENKSYFKYINRYDKEDIEDFVNKLINVLKKGINCAEIKTIEKIVEKYNLEYYEICLISTDTLKSYITSEALKKFYQEKGINVKFEKKYVIKHLNVFENSLDLVRKGYKNLIKILMNETTGYNEIYNISGGYKAIIPLMTQIASYKKVKLAYIYEDSKYLIEIPPFPFEIDKTITYYLKDIFNKLNSEGIIEKSEFERLVQKIPAEKQKVIEYLFIEEDDCYITSEIGDILLNDYLEHKDIELIPCKEKKNEIKGGKHHGKEKVIEFGKKLIQNEYVCEILGSAEYKPYNNNFIQEIEPDGKKGMLIVKIPNEIFTIRVQTSGRNKKETTKIAEILKNKYKG